MRPEISHLTSVSSPPVLPPLPYLSAPHFPYPVYFYFFAIPLTDLSFSSLKIRTEIKDDFVCNAMLGLQGVWIDGL